MTNLPKTRRTHVLHADAKYDTASWALKPKPPADPRSGVEERGPGLDLWGLGKSGHSSPDPETMTRSTKTPQALDPQQKAQEHCKIAQSRLPVPTQYQQLDHATSTKHVSACIIHCGHSLRAPGAAPRQRAPAQVPPQDHATARRRRPGGPLAQARPRRGQGLEQAMRANKKPRCRRQWSRPSPRPTSTATASSRWTS